MMFDSLSWRLSGVCRLGTVQASLDFQHALQGNPSPFGRPRLDLDLVYWRIACQILQAPRQVGQIDTVHGRAHADHGGEELDAFIGMFLGQAIDEMELGPDAPGRTGGGSLNGLDDEL